LQKSGKKIGDSVWDQMFPVDHKKLA